MGDDFPLLNGMGEEEDFTCGLGVGEVEGLEPFPMEGDGDDLPLLAGITGGVTVLLGPSSSLSRFNLAAFSILILALGPARFLPAKNKDNLN